MIKPSPGGEISDAGDFQIQAVVHSLEFFAQNYKKAYSGYYECSLSIILHLSRSQYLHETALKI